MSLSRSFPLNPHSPFCMQTTPFFFSFLFCFIIVLFCFSFLDNSHIYISSPDFYFEHQWSCTCNVYLTYLFLYLIYQLIVSSQADFFPHVTLTWYLLQLYRYTYVYMHPLALRTTLLWPYFIKEKTEAQRGKRLARHHRAWLWNSQDLNPGNPTAVPELVSNLPFFSRLHPFKWHHQPPETWESPFIPPSLFPSKSNHQRYLLRLSQEDHLMCTSPHLPRGCCHPSYHRSPGGGHLHWSPSPPPSVAHLLRFPPEQPRDLRGS